MILEFVFEVDIIWTHFLHILDNVNGNHSFTLFPFYLINIFITKLLEEKPIRERRGFSSFCGKMLRSRSGNGEASLHFVAKCCL